MSLAFSECTNCKRNKIGYICSWEDKFNYKCKNFTPKEKKKLAEETLKPVDDLLEYALEKLGMTKEELKDEMNKDKENIEKAKEMVRLNKDTQAYCDSFTNGCEGCEVKKFKDKYSRFGEMRCDDIFRYLKEKGEI